MSCQSLLLIQLLRQPLEISTGAGNRRVPYTELQRAQGDYVKPKYLPKQVTLKQYYHLRQDDVNAMLDHWAQRQADGKVPLRFKKAAKAFQQKKCSAEENDSNADMGPSEKAEGGPQDNGDIQARWDAASQGDRGRNDLTEEAHPGQSPGNAAKNPSGVGSLLKHGDRNANISNVVASTSLSRQ